MKCPKCGSEHTSRDEVDIGVGIQYGPWRCDDCGWGQTIEIPGDMIVQDAFETSGGEWNE